MEHEILKKAAAFFAWEFASRFYCWMGMSNRIKKQLVIDSITMATGRRELSPGLIFHSDRGSQYCSKKFQKLLRKHNILSSMSLSTASFAHR